MSTLRFLSALLIALALPALPAWAQSRILALDTSPGRQEIRIAAEQLDGADIVSVQSATAFATAFAEQGPWDVLVVDSFGGTVALPQALDAPLAAHVSRGGQVVLFADNLQLATSTFHADVLGTTRSCFEQHPPITDAVDLTRDPTATPDFFSGRFTLPDSIPLRSPANHIVWCSDSDLREDLLLWQGIEDDSGDPVPAVYTLRGGQILVNTFSTNRYRPADTGAPPSAIEFLVANQLAWLLSEPWIAVREERSASLDALGLGAGLRFETFDDHDEALAALEGGGWAGVLVDLPSLTAIPGDALALIEASAAASVPTLLFSPFSDENDTALAALGLTGDFRAESASLLARGAAGIERLVFRQPTQIDDLPLDTGTGYTALTPGVGWWPLARIDDAGGDVGLAGRRDGSLVLGGFLLADLLAASEDHGAVAGLLGNLVAFSATAGPLAVVVSDAEPAGASGPLASRAIPAALASGMLPVIEEDADELSAALASGDVTTVLVESVQGGSAVLDSPSALQALGDWIAGGGALIHTGTDLAARPDWAAALGVAIAGDLVDTPLAIEAAQSLAGHFVGLTPRLAPVGEVTPDDLPAGFAQPLRPTERGAATARLSGGGGSVIVQTHVGRVVVNGFVPGAVGQAVDSSGREASTRLLINQITATLNPVTAVVLDLQAAGPDVVAAGLEAAGLTPLVAASEPELLALIGTDDGSLAHLTLLMPGDGTGWTQELRDVVTEWRQSRRGLLVFDAGLHDAPGALADLELTATPLPNPDRLVRPRTGLGSTTQPLVFDEPMHVASPIEFASSASGIAVPSGGAGAPVRLSRDTGAAAIVLLEEATTFVAGFAPTHLSPQADGDGFREDREALVGNLAVWSSRAPQANYTGPAEMDEGTVVELDASMSRDPFGEALSFAWDLDGDGIYTDGEATAVLDGTAFDGPDVLLLGVRVTNETGVAVERRFTVTVHNVAPRVSVAGNTVIPQGAAFDPIFVVEDVPADLAVMNLLVETEEGATLATVESTTPGRYRLAEPFQRAELGSLQFTVTATDGDGAEGVAAALVEFVNAPPGTPSTVQASPLLPVNQGDDVTFTTSATDPGGDALTFTWTFGDGTPDVVTDVGEVSHAYTRSGTFTLRVFATDIHGASSSVRTLQVSIRNVAPRITSEPPGTIREDVAYAYQVEFEDPGVNDTHTFALDEAPEGMQVSASGVVTWDWDPVATDYLPRPATVRVTDNAGGFDTQSWTITPNPVDSDGGGAPDSCEEAWGFDPTDPADDVSDPSGDGLTVAEACLIGRDPTAFTGPDTPDLIRPLDNDTVRRLPIDFRLRRAEPRDDVPFSSPLTYDIEVFSSEEGDEPVHELRDITPTDPVFVEAVILTLQPEIGSRWWWRARASDPHSTSAWSERWSFVYSPENSPPSAPGIVSPSGFATENPPVLRVSNAVDPDEDLLTYEFELFEGASPTAENRIFRRTGVAEGESGETSVTLPTELEEGQTYLWRVRARDNVQAGPFALASFSVNTTNQPPTTPVILSPEEDSLVIGTDIQTFRWENATDPDEDTLTYRVEFAPDSAFSEILLEVDGIREGREQTTLIQQLPFTASRTIWWRVRAFDGIALGDADSSSFRFVTANTAPSAPEVVAPGNAERVIAPEASVTLIIGNSSDPDGQTLSYHFQVSRSPDFSSLIVSERDVAEGAGGQTSLAVTELPEANLFWRARANDGLAFGAWSRTVSFELRLAAPDPEPDTDPDEDSGGKRSGCAAALPGTPPLSALLILILLGVVRRRQV